MHVATLQPTLSVHEAAEKTWDAVVIGAGPAGSVAAIVFARRGRRVLLVDRATFPRDKVCGCCLAPAAVETLRKLNLSHLLDGSCSAPLSRFDLRACHRRLETPMRGGRVISRYRLDAALARQAIECGAQFLPHGLASIDHPGDIYRTVQLTTGELHAQVKTRIIIAAGGLGSSIKDSNAHNGSRERLWNRSRLGGAAIIADDDYDLPTGTVRMIVARRGYVGFARLEDDRLAVGGAFDASLVRDRHGLAGAAVQALEESNIEAPASLVAAHWLGAPQLTRRPSRVAAYRVLAVGDAAGFVEPFTGEGMTWAIQSAQRAAMLIAGFLQESDAAWTEDIERQWTHEHHSLVRSRQRRCRIIAEVLRHPMALAGCMMAGGLLPRVSQSVVDHIHSPSSARSRMADPIGGSA